MFRDPLISENILQDFVEVFKGIPKDMKHRVPQLQPNTQYTFRVKVGIGLPASIGLLDPHPHALVRVLLSETAEVDMECRNVSNQKWSP